MHPSYMVTTHQKHLIFRTMHANLLVFGFFVAKVLHLSVASYLPRCIIFWSGNHAGTCFFICNTCQEVLSFRSTCQVVSYLTRGFMQFDYIMNVNQIFYARVFRNSFCNSVYVCVCICVGMYMDVCM